MPRDQNTLTGITVMFMQTRLSFISFTDFWWFIFVAWSWEIKVRRFLEKIRINLDSLPSSWVWSLFQITVRTEFHDVPRVLLKSARVSFQVYPFILFRKRVGGLFGVCAYVASCHGTGVARIPVFVLSGSRRTPRVMLIFTQGKFLSFRVGLRTCLICLLATLIM